MRLFYLWTLCTFFCAAAELEDLQTGEEFYHQSLSEARSLWREVYDETLGRVFRMPAFGLTKDQTERVRKTYDALVQFWSSLPNYYQAFYKTGMEALRKTMEQIQSLGFEEMTPENLREVYRVWWTTNENAFFELFKARSSAGP